MKKAVIFRVSWTLSPHSLLFFQMPVLRFLFRTRPAGRPLGIRGRPAAGAAPLFAGCPAPPGHPLFRRRHPQPAGPGRCRPADRGSVSPPRCRGHAGSQPGNGHRGIALRLPGSRHQPHLLRRPVCAGQPAENAGPPPHGPAGAGGIRSRAAGRLREHQRRHHAGPAPLYAGGVRRDAGTHRKRRCHPHLGLSAQDRAGLRVWPASAGGAALPGRSGGRLPLRRRAAGTPRLPAVRDLQLCKARL